MLKTWFAMKPRSRGGVWSSPALHFAQIDADALIGKILLKRKHVIQPVVELIADAELLNRRIVIAGFAEERFARDELPRRTGHDGPPVRQRLKHCEVGIVLIRCQYGQAGVFVRTPGEGRREISPVSPCEVDLTVTDLSDADESIEQRTIRRHRAADIECALQSITLRSKRAGAQHQLAERLVCRPLAGHIPQSAGTALPVERRRGALQDVDAFEAIGLDAVIVDVQSEAVEELQSLEAPDQSEFASELPFAEVGVDSSGILQRFACRLGIAIGNLLGRDGRDGSRQFEDRHTGFRPDACRARHVAVDAVARLGVTVRTGYRRNWLCCRSCRTRGTSATFASGLRALDRRPNDIGAALNDDRRKVSLLRNLRLLSRCFGCCDDKRAKGHGDKKTATLACNKRY